eukprot:4154109-Prorocentrum_lima.AAC.1
MVEHGLEPTLLEQQTHTPSCLFKEPNEMEPTIQQWICMRDPENNPEKNIPTQSGTSACR